MQKTAITLGLCLAFGIPAQAGTGSPQSGLSRLCLESEKACAYYYGDGKLAFIENESFDVGEKFDRIDLSKGNALIPAQNDRKKYGYINTKGQWVIQPQFYWTGNFSNGLAAVETGGGPLTTIYAYINTQGQIVIPDGQYYNPKDFADNGLAAVHVIKNVFIVSASAVNYRHEQKNLPKRYQSRAICASPSPAGKCP